MCEYTSGIAALLGDGRIKAPTLAASTFNPVAGWIVTLADGCSGGRLDASDHEPVRADPGVVVQAPADLVLAVGAHDQQGAQAAGLGAGERAREEDHALLGEPVHECGVVGDVRLRGNPAVDEAGACPADDGVEAHRARAIREWNVFWRR
jgi:hypothetical protein